MTTQQRLVLYASILASFVAGLDVAIVNVALPAIRGDLGGGFAAQQWVVDAYLISLGSLILIAGSLSDIFGLKRVLAGGLFGFGLASILCAVSPNINFLIAMRALQGISGALLVPSSLALIISTFSGAAQGKAIGTWTAWISISFIIGPLVGGLLVDNGSWRLVFAINIIPIAVTLWLLTRINRQPSANKDMAVDTVGAVLCALGLGGPVFALIEQPHLGWHHPLIYLPLIVGLLIFASFLIYERRANHPMLPLTLFKHHNFAVGNIATFAIYACLTAWTFTLIVFLQQVSGYSGLSAGLSLLPVTLIMFSLSSIMGKLAGKYGPRWFMGFGPIIAALGMIIILRVSVPVHYFSQLLPGLIIFGIGLVSTVAPLTAAILGDVEKQHAGIASAVNNAVARVAGLLAVAAIGAIIAAQFGKALDRSTLQLPSARAVSSAITEAKSKPLDLHVPDNVDQADKAKFKASLQAASLSAFRAGIFAMAGVLVIGGLVSVVGIKNPD